MAGNSRLRILPRCRMRLLLPQALFCFGGLFVLPFCPVAAGVYCCRMHVWRGLRELEGHGSPLKGSCDDKDSSVAILVQALPIQRHFVIFALSIFPHGAISIACTWPQRQQFQMPKAEQRVQTADGERLSRKKRLSQFCIARTGYHRLGRKKAVVSERTVPTQRIDDTGKS